MRNRLLVVLGILGTALAVVAAQANVTGRWDMILNSDQGANSATLNLTQDGETLGGSITSDQGTVEFEGTVSGNKVEWVIEVDAGGTFLEIAIEGTVDGDEMMGSADFGGYGGGDWTAKAE